MPTVPDAPAAGDTTSPLTPLLSTSDPTAAAYSGYSSSLRQAALQAAQDDMHRRSDSPVANSPSQSPNGQGSASVSGAPGVRIAPSLLRRGGVDASENGPAAAQQPPPDQTQPQQGQGNTDSITLGQMKAVGPFAQRSRSSVYTFPSPPPDTSDLMSELEEFFSYVEVPQVIDHKDSFNEAWPHTSEFVKTPKQAQLEHIKSLLDGLGSSDAEVRFTNARHLLYIAQGTFQSSTSPEHHLHLILGNVGLLRQAGALSAIWEAVKGTCLRWEGVSTIPDPDLPPHASSSHDGYSAHERQEALDEINGELALHLAVLYFTVEVYRGDEDWGQELMSLQPPMPIYLFNLVAGLRERNAKGYPVKKLLLLLWKSILSCIGGMKDIARVKTFVREVEGLPADVKDTESIRPETKVAPPDFQSFRNEITSKYPSFQPPPIPLVMDVDRISAAAAPLPVRPTFSYHVNPNHDPSAVTNGGPGASQQHQQPMPGTPAPSPPPSPAPPKPKKQQFQTDQTKPFVMPFAPANAGPRGRQPRAVPASIDEAGELYRRNMRISTELWQTWKLREEYIADESGILKAAQLDDLESERRREPSEALAGPGPSTLMGKAGSSKLRGRGIGNREDAVRLSRRMESLVIDSSGSEGEEDAEDNAEGEDPMDPLSMLRSLERQLRADEEKESDEKQRKTKAQRRMDVQRLQRVEQLYRAVLPQMQSAVIVLLKLLLATVTANSNANNGGGAPDSGNDEPIEPSLEDTDINRHREITSKAVSAILILTLKWFKTSHVMKFHYLSQLLVDSNCLLLILKMFGLQEVSTSVKTKHERPDQNFFRFCHEHINPSSDHSPRPEDAMLGSKPAGAHASAAQSGSSINAPGSGADDDEVELITDYSWRNFFAVINFVHILQKLTKRKTHRVLLLVQYKSSAILKRILKVSHPTLQLYVLKVIKSQVPYCGRKWRQSNMKVITAIYLHCRPDLRDEWLIGIDVDSDVEESLPHEQALRQLVRFFNTKHYGAFAPQLHRRSSSANNGPPEFGHVAPDSPGAQGVYGGNRPSSRSSNSSGEDSFPPTRSVNSFDIDSSFRTAYAGTDVDDFGEYEVDDLLLYPRGGASGEEGGFDWLENVNEDWERLGDMVGEYDDISDSESVGSLSGLLAGYGRGGAMSDGSVSDFDIDEAIEQERSRHEWEHISPETITALEEERAAGMPNSTSPRPNRRRSSTGPISPALRPVLIDRDDDQAEAVDDKPEGPVEAAPHSGPAVDEVELVWKI